ncbi:MAG: methyltransferase domain-containing protein [Actinomycetota bacterium]
MADPEHYVLGHSDTELRRLESQARVIDPITRRFLLEAGVVPGMRVLDVGSGGGDVALLLADLVGPGGEVVGFDRSEVGIQAARAKAAARSASHVTFFAGTIDELVFDEPFDAVVGRYVLQFQSDPAALLAAVAAHARPGAPVVFHELDWSGVTSDPAVPSYDRLRGWLQAAIERSGANPHVGLALPSIYAAAGLPDPVLRLEQRLGSGVQAAEVIERIGQLAVSLAPAMVGYGIVTAEELDADTLVERMLAEATERHSVLRSHLQVGAWAPARPGG